MQTIGICGLVFLSSFFSYYILWVIVTPFVPIEDNFHKYFLPNKYAFILPSFIIILVTTSVMGYLGYILINSEHYRKPTIKPWEDYKNIQQTN